MGQGASRKGPLGPGCQLKFNIWQRAAVSKIKQCFLVNNGEKGLNAFAQRNCLVAMEKKLRTRNATIIR